MEEVGATVAKRSRRRPGRPRLVNPYAVGEESRDPRNTASAAGAVLVGVAGLAALSTGTALADEHDDDVSVGFASGSGDLFSDAGSGGGVPFYGSDLVNGDLSDVTFEISDEFTVPTGSAALPDLDLPLPELRLQPEPELEPESFEPGPDLEVVGTFGFSDDVALPPFESVDLAGFEGIDDVLAGGVGRTDPTASAAMGVAFGLGGSSGEGSSGGDSSSGDSSGAAVPVEAAGSAGSRVPGESVQGSPPAGSPAAQENAETSAEAPVELPVEDRLAMLLGEPVIALPDGGDGGVAVAEGAGGETAPVESSASGAVDDVPVAGTDTLPILEPATTGAVLDVPGDGAMAVGAAGSGDTGVPGDVVQGSAAVEDSAARRSVDVRAEDVAEDVGEEQRALSLDELLAGVGAAGTAGGVGKDVPGGAAVDGGGDDAAAWSFAGDPDVAEGVTLGLSETSVPADFEGIDGAPAVSETGPTDRVTAAVLDAAPDPVPTGGEELGSGIPTERASTAIASVPAGSGVSGEAVQGSPLAGGPAAQENVGIPVEDRLAILLGEPGIELPDGGVGGEPAPVESSAVEADDDVPVAGTGTLPIPEPATRGSGVVGVPGDAAAAVLSDSALGFADDVAEDVGEEQRALSLDELLAGVGAAGTVDGVGEDVPGGVEATVGGAFVPGEVSLPGVSQPGESGFAWSVLPGSAGLLGDAEFEFPDGIDLSQLRFAPGDEAAAQGVEDVESGDLGVLATTGSEGITEALATGGTGPTDRVTAAVLDAAPGPVPTGAEELGSGIPTERASTGTASIPADGVVAGDDAAASSTREDLGVPEEVDLPRSGFGPAEVAAVQDVADVLATGEIGVTDPDATAVLDGAFGPGGSGQGGPLGASQPGRPEFSSWSFLPGSADVLVDGAELGFAEGTDLSQLRFAPGDVAGFEDIEGVLGTGDVGGSDAGAALAAALGITPDRGADPGGPDSTVDAAFGAAQPPSDPGTSALLDTREGGETPSAVPTTARIATSRTATPGSPQGPATTGASTVPTSVQLPGLAPWSQPGVSPTVGAARTPAPGGRPGVADESAPARTSAGGDNPAATGGAPARSAGDGERGDRTNPVRDLFTVIGRAGIGAAHLGAAPFSDGFRSQESLFFDEPSQVQRARDSFGTAREAIGRLIPGDEPEQAPQAAATDANDQDEDAEKPWRITTFDEENWPPEFELEPRQLAFAALGILPTVGLTANQRAIANATSTAQELLPSAATLPRSVTSDIALGGLPIEVFEGDAQNALGRSAVSGTVIAGLDEFARTASRNLPEIQRRNNEFWLNRGNRPNQYAVSRAPGTPQLSSGLARPTVFSIAPSVTAFNLAADAVTDRFDIDPKPTDENNNRYYAELLTDSLATGAGVFLPIAGENYLSARAAALRAGTPMPRVGNVAAQTALAFGLPAAQTFAAGILTEEPPDTTDPIYRGTRAAFRYIADDVAEVNDTLLGEAREEDGNDANATRAVGNAAATVATPVLDAVGGIAPNALAGLGDSWNYLMTGERKDPRPVVSDEALASAEESRARAQRAWELSREGDPNTRADAAVQAGANLLYSVGRGTIGLVHSAARIADPFQSEESRFLLEPTQRERAAESFDRAERAWEQAGDAINYLRGRSPGDGDSTGRQGDRLSVPAGSGVPLRVTVTGSPNEESRSRSGFPICSDAGQIECVEPGSLDLDDPASVGSVRVGSGGVRSASPQTGRVTEFPLCSADGQVDCVEPDSIDRGNPNSVGTVVRGDGRTAFTDAAGRRVQYDACSAPGEIDCLAQGTNQLLVGSGRPTRTDEQGRRVEVITYESLRRQYDSMTPEDYRRALQRDAELRYTTPGGTRVPTDRAGRPSPALSNPLSVENVRGTLGNAAEYVGDQLERLPFGVGRLIDRVRGDRDDPDRGVVNRGGR